MVYKNRSVFSVPLMSLTSAIPKGLKLNRPMRNKEMRLSDSLELECLGF